MSSTSAQIDESKKLAARVEAGEQVYPVQSANTGGAGADQLTTATPQQPNVDISEDTTMAGLNRENMPVVSVLESTPVIDRREIAPVVGKNQEQLLAKQFLNPTVRAEEQTALPDSQMTTAEKQTQIPDKQREAAERIAKGGNVSTDADAEADETTAAKQTKVPEAQAESDVAKAEKHETHEDHEGHVEGDEAPKKTQAHEDHEGHVEGDEAPKTAQAHEDHEGHVEGDEAPKKTETTTTVVQDDNKKTSVEQKNTKEQ
jgi:hypothetical protein